MKSTESYPKFQILQKQRLLLLLGCFALLLFQSCVPQSGSNSSRRSQASTSSPGDSNEPNNTPSFDESINYLQNGETTTTTNLSLSLSYEDHIYLRGPGVDRHIRSNSETQSVQCLVSHHPQSEENEVLIAAMAPKDFYNFSTAEKEFYYLINLSDENKNRSFCQKPGLLSTLSDDFSGSTVTYSLSDLCTSSSCNEQVYSGESLVSYTPSGNILDNIDVDHLSLRLLNQSDSSEPTGMTCENNSECSAQGFDCCSSGQCVNDLELKAGATEEDDYPQSVEDINEDPNAIYDYPHLYHICSIPPDVSPTPEPDDTDETQEAQERFTKKEELYRCTTPIDAEVSYCTLTFENASEDGKDFYQTLNDDRTFHNTYSGTESLPPNSLHRVIYAGETLYESGDKVPESGLDSISGANDTLNDSTTLEMTKTPSSSAPDDTLKVTYTIDGTCEQYSNGLARCTKFYVQGQDKGKVDDHRPASNEFKLPTFADTSRTVRVTVDGQVQMEGSDWELNLSSPPRVVFQGTGLQVFDTQKVAIKYFVDTNQHDVLQQKEVAKSEISELCGCEDNSCSLKPKRDKDGQVVDYICDYPDGQAPEPPLQQTIMLSSKSTPHRYFDNTGLAHDEVFGDTPEQEGNVFEYEGGDLLKPNNEEDYIGFNEIYGSYTVNPGGAKPAKQVDVEKGTTYDIFVDSGSYSSCFYCGHDYYSNLVKLFPKNFTAPGGGYTPEPTQSSKLHPEKFRGDDLTFGRSCFVPASMIPWSHHADGLDAQLQRLKRLQSQHFLYANGYQRDWYGFDYGSVIGSFDGVKWFSVGSQRRIKAQTSKLFLAINAPFGDLTSDTSYSVTVSEASINPNLQDPVTSDFESDGAQCQQYHVCDTDADCARQLGWEYSCENVSNISTNWPVFNDNAQEIPNATDVKRLMALTKAHDGGSKRCVYRGRGAPCSADYALGDSSNTYSQTEEHGHLACTTNNYCQELVNAVPQKEFNNRISRYARSIPQQNASETIEEDNLNEFGLGARLIGRPLRYNGDEEVQSEALQGLSRNNVNALCIPGRNPGQADTTYNDANKLKPGPDHQGDKVNAMGVTPTSDGPDPHYLNACSVFDNSTDNYLHESEEALTKKLSESASAAGKQALPTNALKLFESPLLADKDLLKDFENEFIDEVDYQANRCLRAPGSACHTDMDCAPNEVIKRKIGQLNYNFNEHKNIINEYEFKYWQEKLVCSQSADPGDEDFSLSNNRCCRPMGEEMVIGTLIDQSPFSTPKEEYPDFDNEKIPGIEIGLDSSRRYSRNSTIKDLLKEGKPALESARDNYCGANSPRECHELETGQWETLAAMAQRTSCSGHWVRNFHQENGGGHKWFPEKLQTFDKTAFKCKNWAECRNVDECANGDFTCSHVDDPSDPNCRIRNVSRAESDDTFEFVERLELTGIPQVPVHNRAQRGPSCIVDPNDQSTRFNVGDTGPNAVMNITDQPIIKGDRELLVGGEEHYAAHENNNFSDGLKQVFSKDSFSSCIPAGTEVDDITDESQCCTGFINEESGRCALPDYADVSLFFNRYVSSAAKDLSPGLFDEETGYISSTSTVEQLACIQKTCASGFVARGVAISNLKVPGHSGENEDYKVRRFLDGNDSSNNFSGLSDLYDLGLKWNNHVYCIPEDLASQDEGDLTVTQCSEF